MMRKPYPDESFGMRISISIPFCSWKSFKYFSRSSARYSSAAFSTVKGLYQNMPLWALQKSGNSLFCNSWGNRSIMRLLSTISVVIWAFRLGISHSSAIDNNCRKSPKSSVIFVLSVGAGYSKPPV